jgi:thymidylate kinase
VSARRKTVERDRYERDLALLARVRDSYLRQAGASEAWIRLDADRNRDEVAADVYGAVSGLT